MSHTLSTARPCLKWAGGKRQLLERLRPHYPARVTEYFEPFVGSGAVFFDLIQHRSVEGPIHLWDTNAALINVYRQLRDGLGQVVAHLQELAEGHDPEDRSFYYAQRERFNQLLGQETAERAALFIYLNRTCFNGLYRVNRSGCFNVPAGSYKNPRILNADNLKAVSLAVQGVELRVADFRTLRDHIGQMPPDTFVYFDPPYHPLSESSNFTSYTAGAFQEREQRELALLFSELAAAGIKALLSNSWTPLIQDLYAAFGPVPIPARRTINSVAHKRGEISEALVWNWDQVTTVR